MARFHLHRGAILCLILSSAVSAFRPLRVETMSLRCPAPQALAPQRLRRPNMWRNAISVRMSKNKTGWDREREAKEAAEAALPPPPSESAFVGVFQRLGLSITLPGTVAVLGHNYFSATLIHNLAPLSWVMFSSELLSCTFVGGFVGSLWSLQYLLVTRGTISSIVQNTWGKITSDKVDQATGQQVEAVVRQFVLSLYEIPGIQGAFIRFVLENTGVLGEPGIQRLLDEVSQKDGSSPIGLSRILTVSTEGAISGRLEDLKYLAVFGLVCWTVLIDGLLVLLDAIL